MGEDVLLDGDDGGEEVSEEDEEETSRRGEKSWEKEGWPWNKEGWENMRKEDDADEVCQKSQINRGAQIGWPVPKKI